jgi:hypothetical protein
MKRNFFFASLVACLIFLCSFVVKPAVNPAAENVVKPAELNAKNIFIPIGGKTGVKVSLYDLRNMKQSQLEVITGRKMNFFEHSAFNSAQRKLKKQINEDGVVTGNKLKRAMGAAGDGTTGFHIGGFALGFLVGLIGVLIAYLIHDDKKRNRVKWAWIGFAAWLVIYFALIFPALF